MNSKTINFLGIITVFLGLFSLMSLHVSHHIVEEDSVNLEEDHKDSEEVSPYYHIALGFPVSILGAMLLILAEKHENQK